jgi:hypothetical protein
MQPHDQLSEHRLAHAVTREGYVLPVIDVTHPRFAVPDDPETVRAHYERFAAEAFQRRMPRFVTRLMLKWLARRSRLVKAMFGSGGTFLDGVSTYVMKLGVDNLVPPFDTPVDRRFAASPHVPLLRLRMQQIASLLEETLTESLEAAEGVPLHLVNIGGGPAVDSINVLILLNQHRPDLLQRRMVIHVLDGDDAGPYFGANALAALKEQSGPLQGLDIDFEHRSYDWNAPAALEYLIRELSAVRAIIAASSEGALFEYGSDEAIVANLRALRADGHGVTAVAGSVTGADPIRRRMIRETSFKLIPRGLEGFTPLAERAGMRIAKSVSNGISVQVLLRPV